MKTSRYPLGLAALTAALLVFSVSLLRAQDAVPSVAATAIASVPYKITKPGVYVVRKDLVLTSASGTAISIQCGDVVLDLGMRTISSGAPKDNTNTSIGISLASGTGNFTIRNGTLRGFRAGMDSHYLTGNEKVIVQNVTASGCGHYGLMLELYYGELEIDNCQVRNTGYTTTVSDYYGIYGVAPWLRIANCRVINTQTTPLPTVREGTGIYSIALKTGVVTKNYVAGCGVLSGSYAIILSSGEQTVSGNSAFDCAYGITFANGASGKYQDNLTVNCNTPFSAGGATNAGGNY